MSEPIIEFVHEDSDRIIAECKAFYEASLNRQISPADIEMLLINGLAYRELLVRSGVNEAARQNMVSFARGAALEYLGELVGVSRLPASSALCTIEFALIEGHNGVTIPEGLRVQSTDGKVIFQTIETKVCPIGTLTAQLKAAATTAGAIGNDYGINKINIILDPQAFIATAQNIDVTAGGANAESDDELRERIMLAPASFSVAGPKDAYVYFAKSAHPSIVDVAVTSPNPGDVNIYPLLEGGLMPTQEILDAVQAICNADKIRPLTDSVYTLQPTSTDYAIEVNLTLLTNAVTDSTKSKVEAILNTFKEDRKNRLGVDVVRSQLIQLSKIDGEVYDVEVVSPAANIVADPEVYTNCTSITVNVIGTHDE